MTDAERIDFVDRFQLDVWYAEAGADFVAPPGWVVDMGQPDASLWRPSVFVGNHAPVLTTDGGTSLVIGKATWRAAVDGALEALATLGVVT